MRLGETMQLKAVPKTINEIFSLNTKYVVPRFQREYSWNDEQIIDFWDDIIAAMTVDSKAKKVSGSEYFIGPLVLIGDDSSPSYSIVDGQQRLTTVTVLLRALVSALEATGDKAAADALYYNYVEGKDNEGNPYFKLQNETPKPFFQKAIQNRKQVKTLKASSDEERALLRVAEIFSGLLSPSSLAVRFSGIPADVALRGIRDQVLSFLKVVYISVIEEDDAYAIFETLNARGLNLSSTDLIKNTLLRRMKETHPNDDAKDEWNKLRTSLAKCGSDIDTFIRHYWNSKFSHSSEDRLYKNFKKAIQAKKIKSERDFLDDLLAECERYRKIARPDRKDWKEKHKLLLYRALEALDVFRVTQPRPFIMAVLASQHANDTLKKVALLAIENFHFAYTAICSLRASGMDSKYGSAARDLRAAKSAPKAKAVINDLIAELKVKMPKRDVFVGKFFGINVSGNDERQRRVVQYFFKRLETYHHGGFELVPEDLSIEHIEPQSGKAAHAGAIGNLLPLAGGLNSIAGSKAFSAKLVEYKKSKFREVAMFCSTHVGTTKWGKTEIDKRTKELGELAYEKIFVLESAK